MFEAATKDGPFAYRGVSIDFEMLLSMMNGDEELVLNPGSARPWRMIAPTPEAPV